MSTHTPTPLRLPPPLQYAGLGTLGFPAGAAGTLDVYTQQAEFVASRADVAVNLALALGTMELRCRSGGCLTNLWSFDSLYAGLPAGMQPALANFGVGPKGDAAFARMRLTVAPLLIKRGCTPARGQGGEGGCPCQAERPQRCSSA